MQRRLLVFDLDETLVHATECELERLSDFRVDPYFVYKRPYLAELLAAVAREFDLAVWSSSSRAYVDAVVAEVFGDHLLKFAWSVERCVQRVDSKSNSYVYIKDLRKIQSLGYMLDQITMIDDSAEKIVRQPRNHLLVKPFTGQPDDTELLELVTKLTHSEQVC